MRAAVVLALALAGCGNPAGSDCQVDDDCGGGDVCARNGECAAASDVRTVRVTWKIRGMTPSATTCAMTPNLYIYFSSGLVGDTYGYEPVPCAAGVFTIDKLPKRFNAVELGVQNTGYSEAATFDAQGNAMLDLAP